MKLYKKIRKFFKTSVLVVTSSVVGSSAYAALTYDTTTVVADIESIGTIAGTIFGAFIALAITLMFYRKVRSLVSRG